MWMNYRADRAKQILSSIVNWSSFEGFSVSNMKDTLVFSFLPVDKKIKTYNLIEPTTVKNSLGLYLSELDFTQARIAESEKFPHVTYFLMVVLMARLKDVISFIFLHQVLRLMI